jgi:feruloyl-CoA synthase
MLLASDAQVTSPRNGGGDVARAPFAALPTVEPRLTIRSVDNGALILRDPRGLGTVERSIVAHLRHWAYADPDRLMIAQRGPAGQWIKLSYGEMRRRADAVGQGLLERGVQPGQTLLILSGNSIEHATIALGAQTVGICVVPVSPAYSSGAAGQSKLAHIFATVRPAMIFAKEWDSYAAAVAKQAAAGIPIVAVSHFAGDRGIIPFSTLLATRPTAAVEEAYARTGPDTVAKILFSSGSTGRPKGIINTQRMLCVNMAMVDAMWAPEENTHASVTLNWMPWNHTMAGNGLFNRSLRQGGAYYIDDGRPLAGEFDKTLRNLLEISPHSYSDVPAGYAMLTSALERDSSLAERFFRNISFVQYAGASLPDEVWQRFQAVSVRVTGKRVPFLTGYGCTEAGPLITQLYWPVEGSGYIGVPVPGIELKLVPIDATRYEARARGPNMTPGYIGDADGFAAALDAEGFYRTGDSLTFVDREDPIRGLRFATRVAEDFKLLTGTFVPVAQLRSQLVGALSPLVTDLVIAGENRDFLAALVWPDLTACRQMLGNDELGAEQIVRAPAFVAAVRAAIHEHNRAQGSSSMRIDRVCLLEESPNGQANEITDKGYINQRAVLERRAASVEKLYAEPPHPDVLVINGCVGVG